MNIDWEAEAKRAAKLACYGMREAHRGAFMWHAPSKTAVMFANDGMPNEQIELLQPLCGLNGIQVRAVAVESDYTFAVLVECDDLELLTDFLWGCWEEVRGGPTNERTQRRIADDCIARHFLEQPWERDYLNQVGL